ncbi:MULTISPECIES: ABC transporter permease [unclassified Frankia]|uniref:ABC transporter permease n=1 Tax=unclassified Frankia TaxID=2632575 RepID=UPI002AD3871D|nr:MULTISPECIES: ABC transporter permease [unclassified Frankia]
MSSRVTVPRINLGFNSFSGLYLLALFVIVFGIWTPHLFLTAATVQSVASQQAVTAMLAIAVLIPLTAGAYDLSVGATINFSTIICVWLQTDQGWSMWPAIAVAIAACVVIGVINGFVIVRLRVNSFIATLGMGSIITAVQDIVSGQSQPTPPTTTSWLNLTRLSVAGFQIIVLYLLVLALIVWWALDHTPAGRYLYASGGNPEAARLAGVSVGRYTWFSMIASATVCGIAGVFYGSQTGPSLTFGVGLLLPAFAAVFLGSTQIKPGRFNLWGTMLAIYVLAVGVKGLQLITGVQWLAEMFNGVALVGAVSFAMYRQRLVQSRALGRSDDPLPEVAEPTPIRTEDVAGLVPSRTGDG